MDTLRVGELVHDGLLYDGVNNFLGDLPFYAKWCGEARGDVLELCCGTGRLTIPLRQSGIRITGLDFTPSMLDRARQKAGNAGIDLGLLEGDMRSFELNRRFRLIFIPFNSIQNTYSLSDLERIFSRVRRHLAPGGRFILDIFNPDFHMMLRREKSPVVSSRFTLEDGRRVVIMERCAYDPATQVNRVQWLFRIDEEERMQQLDMRCFFPEEMNALLHYNGFRIVHKFGNYDETPFSSSSPKQLFVCVRKGGKRG